jgi:hypothetical protein
MRCKDGGCRTGGQAFEFYINVGGIYQHNNEGFNSKIQQIESNFLGVRSFQSYSVRIMFFFGKLHLLSTKVSHKKLEVPNPMDTSNEVAWGITLLQTTY